MTPVQALISKELRCVLVSPIFYVIGAVFLLIVGFLAHLTVINATQQAMRLMQIQNAYAQLNLNDLVFRPLLSGMDIVLMFVLPILTMRLFAEEYKLRTFELLVTSPVGLNEIVSAKFLSVLLLYLGLLSLTCVTPLVLSLYSSFDWTPIMTGYVGLILQGGLFLAIGVLGSSLTENQVVAAFVSFGLIVVIWLLGGLGTLLGDTALGNFFSYLSFTQHYDRFVRGLLEVKDIVYYISGIVLALVLAHRVIDSHRWA